MDDKPVKHQKPKAVKNVVAVPREFSYFGQLPGAMRLSEYRRSKDHARLLYCPTCAAATRSFALCARLVSRPVAMLFAAGGEHVCEAGEDGRPMWGFWRKIEYRNEWRWPANESFQELG